MSKQEKDEEKENGPAIESPLNHVDSFGHYENEDANRDVDQRSHSRRPNRFFLHSLSRDEDNIDTNNANDENNSRPPRRFFLYSFPSAADENNNHNTDSNDGGDDENIQNEQFNNRPPPFSCPMPMADNTDRDENAISHFVPPDAVTLRIDPTSESVPSDTNSNRNDGPNDQTIIIEAVLVRSKWTDRPILTKYPRLTYGLMLNVCILVVGCCVLVISLALESGKTTTKTTSAPSQVLSIAPTLSPLGLKYENETLININVEKADANELMGHTVSMSSDGNTFVVSGYQTLHVYTHFDTANIDKQKWIKTIDWKDLVSNENEMGNLSYRSVASVSSDGNHIIVGDMFVDVNYRDSGAVMVFSNILDGEVVQWYQLGSTISGDKHWSRYGCEVTIVDGGKIIGVGTCNTDAFFLYEYDGSEWILKLRKERSKHASHNRVTMTVSANGALMAWQESDRAVVEIYELSKFELTDIIHGIHTNDMGVEAQIQGFGSSLSFSHDGSFLTIGSWFSNQVNVFQFDSEEGEYVALGSSIRIANVTGFGYSVSMSGNGRSFAVGAVSPPMEKWIDNGLFYADENYETWKDMISERGSVYVFRIQGNSWEELVEIEHDHAIYDKIGYSVSLSGDGKVLALGAYGTGGAHGDGPNKNGQVGIYKLKNPL